MRTSDPDIFAVGDAIDVTDVVTGGPVLVPLAGPANRRKNAADAISGRLAGFVACRRPRCGALISRYDDRRKQKVLARAGYRTAESVPTPVITSATIPAHGPFT
jgi:NADPH-dependent 2,4-dienoyl-CoA reductase/sulfur reductase-like enzyme